MTDNPALRKLGFSATDRVVVIHADDVGMCQSTVPAFFDVIEAGLVSCGSTMVACPWFPEVARMYSQHPATDIGIHLTLTCEWDSYRWGPISTRNPSSGFIDSEGYFYRNQSMWVNVEPETLRIEMESQVDRATKAGIDLTHLDSHMFAVLNPKFIAEYVELGFRHRLPVFMVRQPQWVEILSRQYMDECQERGLPVFDHLREMYLHLPSEDRIHEAKEVLDNLPAGLTFFMLHPAKDTPELRAIAGDWQQRVADYEAFMSEELRDHVNNCGIQIIGWRQLRDVMRTAIHADTLSA